MRVTIFQSRFAELVRIGKKRQTIRPKPKRLQDYPRVGERRSFRQWTGAPYRSPQEVLVEGVVISVQNTDIKQWVIAVDSMAEPVEEFAIADGFKDSDELFDWFSQTHGLPFEGILIKWIPELPAKEAK